MKYSDKLRDPRWQKKRLLILNRDKFECRFCRDKTKELHVHHSFYESGFEPWEYPDDSLFTLCFRCHKEAEKFKSEFSKLWCRGSFTRGTLKIFLITMLEKKGRGRHPALDVLSLACMDHKFLDLCMGVIKYAGGKSPDSSERA